MKPASGSIASTADGRTPDFLTRERPMLQRLELSMEHAEWLEDVRKIPSELAAELGFVSVGKNIAFEFRKNGVCLFRKVRRPLRKDDGSPDKTFHIEPSGVSLFLFNEDCLSEPCSPDTPLIICEGEIDVASWMVAGATRVVSVPNGALNKAASPPEFIDEDQRFAYLWEDGALRPDIRKFSKIILATDGDQAGMVLRDELAIRLGRNRCYVVEYPTDCKDANDVLQKCGPDGPDVLMHMIDNAKPMVPNRLVSLMDIPSRGALRRYDSGWSSLDAHLMLVPPELVVVTGTPNAGKSQWVLSWLMNLARLHRLKGAVLQFEDDPDRNQTDVMAYAEAWCKDERANIYPMSPQEWAKKMFYSISPNEDADDEVTFDLAWLKNAIEEAALRHNCKWVLIDPWNEVEHLWKVNENETKYTNDALKELKRMARRFQIAIIIVTHPSKAVKGKTIEELDLYDVSGSNAWNNKADHGIIIHRDPNDDSVTFVKICKSKRWKVMGKPGTVKMKFAPERAGFSVVKN
jgi:twinkle protein